MARIPLNLRLKLVQYRNIAAAQDMIIEVLYSIFDTAVLHGGTGIWRCYHGARFSEDIDVYLPHNLKKLDMLFNMLERRGFVIVKKKISDTSLFSTLQLGKTEVRLESLFKSVKGTPGDYEKTDGTFFALFTLTAEEFIREKIDAYQRRRKVRDLYDIFFLLRYVEDKRAVREPLRLFMRNFKEPYDEKELRELVIEGIVPSASDMLSYIRRGIKNGNNKISQ